MRSNAIMTSTADMALQLEDAQKRLCAHPLYRVLDDPRALTLFMQYHVFAVWDFMSLLKSLQRGLTCLELPWRPVDGSKEVTRFINEIVLGEESDLDQDGKACDHFTLYLRAMAEVGADPTAVRSFLEDFDYNVIPKGAREFVKMNLALADSGELHRVAAAFFYGREKLIPAMFDKILDGLKEKKQACPTLVYYLERHIELDGEEHSHLARQCLESLCADDPALLDEAYETALLSLESRSRLWDAVLEQYRQS
ncbi:DUF3050 domain-containing protein [Thiohalophilus thiocyanatoxydans]|uniref:DUF3050 family protein n=1 Tax=Thiohalophilus thiocyanatoxydans TaxID=381308 RepID=A0A4R8IHE4_9GAMM|nr:DUF3050 domain-containing protein [Thiohalophilus thiocyanatoxydans]TDY00022.1 DUF3050 family protein [Thiohalophilus thiocyanatoxydans]